MDEPVNPGFRVEEESGHPGYHVVRLIGAPLALDIWLACMSEKLSDSSAVEANSVKNDRGERLLFRSEAVDSNAPQKRVTVSFYVAKDLTFHHVRPSPKDEFFDRHGCLIFWVMLILAIIGKIALATGFYIW